MRLTVESVCQGRGRGAASGGGTIGLFSLYSRALLTLVPAQEAAEEKAAAEASERMLSQRVRAFSSTGVRVSVSACVHV